MFVDLPREKERENGWESIGGEWEEREEMLRICLWM